MWKETKKKSTKRKGRRNSAITRRDSHNECEPVLSPCWCCCRHRRRFWNISLSVLPITRCAFRFRSFGNRNCFCFRFRSKWCEHWISFVLFLNLVFIMIIILSSSSLSSISFIDQGHRHFVNDLSTLILMTLFVVVVGGVDDDNDDDGVVSLLLSYTHRHIPLGAIFSIQNMGVWRQRHKIKYSTHITHTSNSKQELINTKNTDPNPEHHTIQLVCAWIRGACLNIFWKWKSENYIRNAHEKENRKTAPKIGFISDWMVNGIFPM